MRNRLVSLAKGNIHEPSPVVKLSVERISGVMMPDKVVVYNVDITSENHIPMRLFFYSENARVTVSKSLSVVQQAKLAIEVNSTGLALSDVIQGDVVIAYNGGEIRIPYRFTIGMAKDGSQEYLFRDLQEFREFSEQNFEEAVNVFSWKEFPQMPFMQDMHFQGLYATFHSNISEDNGLRSFFAACGSPLPEVVKVEKLSDKIRKEFTFAALSKQESLLREYRIMQALLKIETLRAKGAEITESMTEVSEIRRRYSDNRDGILFLSYIDLLCGDEQGAKELLLQIQDQVQKERLEQKDIYCLFLYLASQLQNDQERTDNTKKLIHKYFVEGTVSPLQAQLDYIVTAKENESCEGKQNALRALWVRNFHHSFILLEMMSSWKNEGVSFSVLSDLELRTALFGLRNGMMTEKILFEVLSHPLVNPKHLSLYMAVLYLGYHVFQNVDILQAIMNVLLSRKEEGERYFYWYEEAVRQNLVMEGLYESYLRSCPLDYEGPLPLRIVESFGYKKENSSLPLSLLYSNVLKEYADNDKIQDLYREKIANYALDRMQRKDYSILLKPVYKSILSEAFLNEKTASSMANLFFLHRISTSLSDMKRVILYYPQLEKEDAYGLTKGEAMVPVFSSEAIVAFEDEKGRRYYDAEVTKEKVYQADSLKNRCLLYVDDSLLLRLSEADRIVRDGVAKERELFLVADFIKDPSIVGFYRARLYETLIDLSLSESMMHVDCCEFLLEADFSAFQKNYRTKMIQSLCDRGYLTAAVEQVLKYGIEGLSIEAKTNLLESAAQIRAYQQNEAIINYCLELFEQEQASTTILSFLACNFTGALDTELAILRAARKRHQDTFDLVYKTILNAFFTDRTKDVDTLLEWYLQETNRDEVVVRAYLVYKSHFFFMKGRKMSDLCVSLLKQNLRTLPIVGELALITWFSQKSKYTEEELSEIQILLSDLSSKNITLSCFLKFQGYGVLPFEMMNRVVLEYRSESANQVVVFGYVMPSRNYFHRVMQEIYPGVFVQTFVLYRREWLEYSLRIHEIDGNVQTKPESILAQEDDSIVHAGRMEDLLNLEKKVLQRDDRETSMILHSMLLKEGLNEEIFKKG